jgi:hypothetical protein
MKWRTGFKGAKAVLTAGGAAVLASADLTQKPFLESEYRFPVVAVLTLVGVFDWGVTFFEGRNLEWLVEKNDSVEGSLVTLFSEIRRATRLDPEYFRVGVYAVRRPFGTRFRQSQVRVKTLTIGPTAKSKRKRRWTQNVGVTGDCWRTLEVQNKPNPDPTFPHQVSDWTRIIAAPMVDNKKNRYLGCIVIDFTKEPAKTNMDWSGVESSALVTATIMAGYIKT